MSSLSCSLFPPGDVSRAIELSTCSISRLGEIRMPSAVEAWVKGVGVDRRGLRKACISGLSEATYLCK